MLFCFLRVRLPLLMMAAALVQAGAAPALAKGARPESSVAASETKAQRDARMKWWREARFGMFIHWGVYAELAGEFEGQRYRGGGEWIKSHANIPNAKYDQLLAKFNPVQYDAAAWVRMAKGAGVKYIVITAKHHDGFCLWDSAVSDYDVAATPYKKDLLKPLAEACRKQGIPLGFYYSIMDWRHPSQFVAAKGKHPEAGNHRNEMRKGMKQDYVHYMKAQLKELVESYDPAVLWFDGEWVPWWTHEDGLDLYAYCRTLKPSIIVNNRVDKGRRGMAGLTATDKPYAGDFGTPEQEVPAAGLQGVDWESCITMNDTWGYKHFDQNWKSPQTLIRQLIDIASKGGNYLLNVGPTGEGLIPPASVERLEAVGQWMKLNGESIYGTSATPLGKLPWGRSTEKQGRLYLHVFDWPEEGRLEMAPLANKITGAYLLADTSKKPLQVVQSDKSLFVLLPASPSDKIATVIVLEVEGDVSVAAAKLTP